MSRPAAQEVLINAATGEVLIPHFTYLVPKILVRGRCRRGFHVHSLVWEEWTVARTYDEIFETADYWNGVLVLSLS